MVFDTAAGELSPAVFKTEVQPYLTHLAQKFPGKLGYYSKGTTSAHVGELRQMTSFAGFGLDHRFELSEELKRQGTGFLQGNFDQALLFCSPEEFESRLDQYLKPLSLLTPEQRRFWVCGLGHGVLPGTPEVNVARFVQKIREVFR